MTSDLTVPERGRHTPGPWRIYGPEHDTLGGRSLTILAGTGKARFGVAQIRIINPNDALEASANANLIAAAPDLLAAAETVLAGLNERIDAATDRTPVFAGIAALSDAIHKARGGQ
jgi:hypothetical protein